LEWALQWGQFEDFLLSKAKKGETVKALDDRPELFPDLVCYWKAFNELHKARPVAAAPTPIPIPDILAWLTIFDIRGAEARQDYYHFISVLDSAWLKWARKKLADESERRAKNR
jgi:hypothetical protein